MEASIFRPLSIGIVAENKPLDSKEIDVIPIEMLNLMDGELSSQTVDLKSSGLNEDGSTYTAEVKMGATLKAEWTGSTNRTTAPDVRRGEQVIIYSAGNDKFYWNSIGRDDKLRRLETVIYRWSGLPDNNDEEITADNSYFMEVSTHEKTITVKTSKRNGEFCNYTMQFNPGKGQWTCEDDLGNIIQIDSEKTFLHMTNADKSKVELDKTKIVIDAPKGIKINTTTMQLSAATVLIEAPLVEIAGAETRVKGTLHADMIHTNMLHANLPIFAPGIFGAPFIPALPVLPVMGVAPPVS